MNDIAAGPRLIWARDLDRLPARSWLAGHSGRVIPAGGLVCLYGPPGAGKSFVALDIACEVALTHPVVYACSEGLSGVAARVKAWCRHHGKKLDALRLAVWPGAAYLAAAGDEQNQGAFSPFYVAVDGLASEHGQPVLVIVDTLSNELDAVGGDDVDARDMGAIVNGCKTVRDAFGCAVLLVHHTNAEGTRERGNAKIRQAMDVMIELATDDERVTFVVNKQKDGQLPAPREFFLLPVTLDEPDADGLPVTSCVAIDITGREAPIDPDTLYPNQRKMLAVLADDEFSAEGCSWSRLLTLTGIKENQLQRTKAQLLKRGLVAQDRRNQPYRITPAGRVALTQAQRGPTVVTRTPSHPASHPTPIRPHMENGHGGEVPKELQYVGDAWHERRALECAHQQGMQYWAGAHAGIIRDEARRRHVQAEVARIRGN